MYNFRVLELCAWQASLGFLLFDNFPVVKVVSLCSSLFLQHLSLQLPRCSCIDKEAFLFCIYECGMPGGYPFTEPLSLLLDPTLSTACYSIYLLRCHKLLSNSIRGEIAFDAEELVNLFTYSFTYFLIIHSKK